MPPPKQQVTAWSNPLSLSTLTTTTSPSSKTVVAVMYCTALSTGLRLLAKYFSRPPVAPQPTLSSPSSSSSPIDELVKSKPCVNANILSGVEVYKHDFIGETFGKSTIGSIATMGRSNGRTRAAKPVVIASNVSCRVRGDFLETRNKSLKPIEIANPILVRKAAEEAELEELVEQVRQMHQELEAYKSQEKISTRIPAYVEEDFTGDLGEPMVNQETRGAQDGFVTGWIDTAEVADFAIRIARCDDMTVEGVDEVLHDIHARMNTLVLERAKNTEEKIKWMGEVAHKIKEYAEVLLDTPCEVQLAVERASVHAAGLRHANDIQYLASLAPGSSHVAGCDLSCVGSYLPHRVEREYQDSEPELSVGGSSRSSSPSLGSIPSTPRSSSVGLPEDNELVVGEEAVALVERFDGIPSKSPKQRVGSFERKKNSKASRTGGVVVKPAWR